MSTIPRAAYARLATAGFPSITDRHGNPPLVIDPSEVVRFDLELEEGDPQQCNEIVVQFLAMTGLVAALVCDVSAVCKISDYQTVSN